MSGKAVTPEQVELFMKKRADGDTQQQASAKAGISERSGRRIDSGILPKKKDPRHWRTRKDPFVDVWDQEILPLLEKRPTPPAAKKWRITWGVIFHGLGLCYSREFSSCAHHAV